jgi:hypothetical protein
LAFAWGDAIGGMLRAQLLRACFMVVVAMELA